MEVGGHNQHKDKAEGAGLSLRSWVHLQLCALPCYAHTAPVLLPTEP